MPAGAAVPVLGTGPVAEASPPAIRAELAVEAAAPLPPRGASADEVDAAVHARLRTLEQRIAVTFRRPELLREAMTHASWNNERGRPSGPGFDNERLEYLGDAVLELVVGEHLFRRFPSDDEGRLTQLRASLVNTLSLARMAETLGMGDILLLGRGAAKTGASKLPSLLANAFEALIGAIFLDQGYRVAVRVFLQTLGNLEDWTDQNHKGRLQEAAQERFQQTPHYRATASGGPGHRREYVAEAVIDGEVYGTGTGTTKQAAEQGAALDALERIRSTTRARRRSASVIPPVTSGSAPRARRRATEAAVEAVAEAVAERAAGEAAGSRRGGRRATAAVASREAREVAVAAARQPGPAPSRTRVTAPTPQGDEGRRRSPGIVPAPPVAGAALPPSPRRRGLLSVLRSAAEALVGRASVPGPETPASEAPRPPARPPRGDSAAAGAPSPTVQRRAAGQTTAGDIDEGNEGGAARSRPRSRRGRRGGRGRRRPGEGPSTGPTNAAAPVPPPPGSRESRSVGLNQTPAGAPGTSETSARVDAPGLRRQPRQPTSAPAATGGEPVPRPRRRRPPSPRPPDSPAGDHG